MAWHPTWNDDGQPSGGGRYRHIRVGAHWHGKSILTTLLIVNIAVFVLEVFGGKLGVWIVNMGALQAYSAIAKVQLWRLVTFQFLHGSTNHILWNMFGLWMFGRVVEQQMGPRRFLWMYLVSGIVGGLFEVGFHYLLYAYGQTGFIYTPIVGASAGVCGVLIAFAMLNPNALVYVMFVFPMRAKWIALLYAGATTWWALSALQAGAGEQRTGNVAHAAHLGGMVCAVAWMVLAGYINRPWANRIRSWFVRPRRAPSWSGPAGPSPRRPHPVVGGPNAAPGLGPTAQDEQRLDEILRKIHDGGLSSLSDDEREFLRSMSERTRGDADFDNRYRRE